MISMQGNCAESINQMKLNEIQHLKKEIQNRNDSIPENFAKYLILLAEMNEQPCIETEIDEIMKGFHVINEKEELLRFFQLIRIAKENNILKYLQTLSIKYKPKEKENKSWFQSVKKSILLFMKAFQVSYSSKEEINQMEEIFLISKFTIVFLNFWINLNKNQAIPTSLITLFNKLSKEHLKDCQNFLEFSFQCEIVEPTEVKDQLYYGLQLYTKKRNNTNFLKPINQKISELNSLVKQENDKRTKEIKMQKKRENQIKILRKKMDLLLITMKEQFIPWEAIFSIFNLLPELEEEFREKLITHNKKIIEDKKKILKDLKEQFPDPFINLFLDFGYNITLLNPEEIDTLKKSKSFESFEQLLKH